MEDVLSIPRTSENVQFNIDILNKLGVDFDVRHGTYTTTIVTSEAKARYMLNTYHKRVFHCFAMIKKDVLNSENGKLIMQSKYLKTNYAFSNNVKSYKSKKVLNIDITSAYATCLFKSGLVTQKTYNALKKLPKVERLPCVGMLATSYTNFTYEGGECTKVLPFRASTAPIFFYLIDEINYMMQNIKHLLGKNFIFYWVDGVFFDYGASKKCVQDVENYLADCGYDYKYEDVEDFNVEVDDRKLMVKMKKKEIDKQYVVGIDNIGKDVKNYLYEKIKSQKTSPQVIR